MLFLKYSIQIDVSSRTELIFAELLQGCKNKSELEIIMSYRENLYDSWSNCGIIEAGIVSFEKRMVSKGVGIIDAVIISEARRRNAKVWTLDQKLLSFLSKSEYITN